MFEIINLVILTRFRINYLGDISRHICKGVPREASLKEEIKL